MIDIWQLHGILSRFYSDRKNTDRKVNDYDPDDPLYKQYIQMLTLIIEKKVSPFGDLITLPYFIDMCKGGGITNYDGFGEFLCWDGIPLGYVNCAHPEKYPEGTVFVAWYNK